MTGHRTTVTTMTAERKPGDGHSYTRNLIIITFFQNRFSFPALILIFVRHLTRAPEVLHHSLLRWKHVSFILLSALVVFHTLEQVELVLCH